MIAALAGESTIRVLTCTSADIAARVATELAALGYRPIRSRNPHDVAVRLPAEDAEALAEVERIRNATEEWASQ